MSTAKLRKQLITKPAKLARFDKFNESKKRKFGKSVHPCLKCGKTRGVVRQHNLQYCRQCFREEAVKLGFNKYS